MGPHGGSPETNMEEQSGTQLQALGSWAWREAIVSEAHIGSLSPHTISFIPFQEEWLHLIHQKHEEGGQLP